MLLLSWAKAARLMQTCNFVCDVQVLIAKRESDKIKNKTAVREKCAVV